MQIYLTKEGRNVRHKLPEVSRQVMKQSKISEQQFIQLKKCSSRHHTQRLENKR